MAVKAKFLSAEAEARRRSSERRRGSFVLRLLMILTSDMLSRTKTTCESRSASPASRTKATGEKSSASWMKEEDDEQWRKPACQVPQVAAPGMSSGETEAARGGLDSTTQAKPSREASEATTKAGLFWGDHFLDPFQESKCSSQNDKSARKPAYGGCLENELRR